MAKQKKGNHHGEPPEENRPSQDLGDDPGDKGPKANKEGDDALEEKLCDACGGRLHLETMTLDHYEGEKVIVLENVPALVCEDCGEVWVKPEIIEELEAMTEAAQSHEKKKIHKKLKTSPSSPPDTPTVH